MRDAPGRRHRKPALPHPIPGYFTAGHQPEVAVFRARLAPAALCTLLVLAGCNGVLGDGTPDRSTYAVPEEYPPGIDAETGVDPDVLLDEHADGLRGRSMTIESRHTQRFVANGTVRYRSRLVERVGADDDLHAVQRVGGSLDLGLPGSTARIERWSNESLSVLAVTAGNETTYQADHRNPGDTRDRLAFDRLYLLFSVLDPTPTGNGSLAGDRVTVLRANRTDVDASLSRFPRIREVRNVTFVAWVDEGGVVRGYRLRYDATVGNATVRVTRSLRFRGIGSTTVDRPDWVSAAIEQACLDPMAERGVGNGCRRDD